MTNNKPLLFIFLTILIDCLGLGIIIPTLPALIQELTGESLSAAASYGGWMSFSYAIMSFIFSPILGGLSDRYGRRPILLISLFGLGVDYIFMSLAPGILFLFIGRIIAGICGASFTTASAYIADVSDNSNRTKNFGMIGAAFGLGFIFGPMIGWFFGNFGTKVPFVAAACFSLLNFLFGYFILPESLKKENRRPFDWKRANPFGSLKRLKLQGSAFNLIIVLFILNVAGQAMPSTWNFFCAQKFHWGFKWIGLSLSFVGITVAIVQGGLIGKISGRLGVKKAIFTGLCCYTLGFFLFAFASSGWMMFIFMIPYALGGISVPNIQNILTSRVSASEQGELQGGLTGLISLTSIIGPVLMTSAFSFFTKAPEQLYFPGIPFLIGGVLTLIALSISYFVLKKIDLKTPVN
ncbi:MAG: TCR/Tet family MFS transporter [Bacteroidia bacterium]|nr:TCR/Tet family MFS transporter [Bacteroidia bacterium]